jgi:acyl-CoA synthetase (AMP-forming)/AMP-acid ligase II
MPTDIEIIKYRDAGRAQTYGASDPNAAVRQQNTYFVHFSKASDDAMASTTTSETYTGKIIPHKARIRSIYYVATTGGITADNTNYATVTVSKRDSAAANQLTVATLTTTITSSGNVTQGAPKALVLTDANIIVDALSTLTFTIAKAASGVVVRAGEFVVELERV